jgi:hypothetical protein
VRTRENLSSTLLLRPATLTPFLIAVNAARTPEAAGKPVENTTDSEGRTRIPWTPFISLMLIQSQKRTTPSLTKIMTMMSDSRNVSAAMHHGPDGPSR